MSAYPGEPWAIPQVKCIFGNCTWDTTLSLTAEYVCRDMTSELEYTCRGPKDDPHCIAQLPAGAAIKYRPRFDLGPVLAVFSQLGFGSWHSKDWLLRQIGSEYPLCSTQIIRLKGMNTTDPYPIERIDRNNSYTAAECAIFPAARWITGSVRENSYRETYEEMFDANRTELVRSWNYTTPGPGFTIFIEAPAPVNASYEPNHN